MRRDAASVPPWWDEVLRRILDLPDLEARSLRPFVPPLAALSAHLNDVEERRGRRSVYMHERRLREAYLLYYSTANLLKPLWVLEQLWPAGPPPGETPLRVLDLGCGPGTGVAALHAWMERASHPRALAVEGIDASVANAMLYRRVGEVIREHSGQPLSVEARAGDAVVAQGSTTAHDLVLSLNLLNEIPESRHASFLGRCAGRLGPGGVLLFVEPALRATSRALLRLRDCAVREGWRVRVPCYRQAHCPALEAESDWCHHDLPWVRPGHVAWLDEEIGNVKRSLKFSCLALELGGSDAAHSPTGIDEGRHSTGAIRRVRVVSERFSEKGRTWCHCCGEEGRRVYQRNHRDRGENNADFDHCARYDTLTVEGVEERTHDMRITRESRVRLST